MEATPVERKREVPLPIQLIYITSRNRLALDMCCLQRLILYLESIPIALQLKKENAPTSILFHIIPKEIKFDLNRNKQLASCFTIQEDLNQRKKKQKTFKLKWRK